MYVFRTEFFFLTKKADNVMLKTETVNSVTVELHKELNGAFRAVVNHTEPLVKLNKYLPTKYVIDLRICT